MGKTFVVRVLYILDEIPDSRFKQMLLSINFYLHTYP